MSAAVLVLAGCSEPQQANDTLPTATSTSASPTLEPLGPADFPVPDEAREQTEAGAAAFVRYYVGLVNRSQANLDVTYIEQLSRDCSTCESLSSGFSTLAGSGFSIRGGQISISSLAEPSVTDGEAQFVASLSQEALTVVDSSGVEQPGFGTAAASFPGSGGLLEWVPKDSSWVMTQLTIA